MRTMKEQQKTKGASRVMEMGGSRSMGGSGGGGGSGSNDSSPLDGLKFGKKIYFEDLGSNVQTTSSSSSSKQPASSSSPSPPPPRPPQEAIGVPPPSGRRGRGASAQGGAAQQPPRCQVEGCGQDLTGAKPYYCRHKVCGSHSKSPKVIVAGIEQRFCQQCSRFHQLAEFDQGKRSCRRRLAGHNERRRKPPSGSFSSRYGQLSSSLHEDGRRFGGFLMDFSCPRLPGHSRDYWPAIEASNRHMASNPWPGRLDIPPQSGRVAAQVVVPYAQGSSSGTLFSAHDIPPDECLGVPNSSCALSLLSTQQWGTTAASSSRGLSISSSNYGGPSIGQSSNTPFLGNPWSSHRHETTNPTVPPGMFELRQAMEPDRNQFSGEPGVVPPLSNRLWTDHEHGKGLGPSDDHMHWPH